MSGVRSRIKMFGENRDSREDLARDTGHGKIPAPFDHSNPAFMLSALSLEKKNPKDTQKGVG